MISAIYVKRCWKCWTCSLTEDPIRIYRHNGEATELISGTDETVECPACKRGPTGLRHVTEDELNTGNHKGVMFIWDEK